MFAVRMAEAWMEEQATAPTHEHLLAELRRATRASVEAERALRDAGPGNVLALGAALARALEAEEAAKVEYYAGFERRRAAAGMPTQRTEPVPGPIATAPPVQAPEPRVDATDWKAKYEALAAAGAPAKPTTPAPPARRSAVDADDPLGLKKAERDLDEFLGRGGQRADEAPAGEAPTEAGDPLGIRKAARDVERYFDECGAA